VIGDTKVRVEPCTWEALYPCMFFRHVVIEQVERFEAPLETRVAPKGPAAFAYDEEHYYVRRTRDGDRYLGLCSYYEPTEADFDGGVVVKKYCWKLPVADPYRMIAFVKIVPPQIEFVQLKAIITRDEVKFEVEKEKGDV